MLDRTFVDSSGDNGFTVLEAPHDADLTVPTLRRSIEAYNPFESIVGATPVSFYETLAILNEFLPITELTTAGQTNIFSVLDLDATEGFSMALYRRYPNFRCYGVMNTLTAMKWDFDRSGLPMSNFNLASSTPRTLLSRVLSYNQRGILISYATLTTADPHRLRAAVNSLAVDGTVLLRLDYTKVPVAELGNLTEAFEEVTAYKPAVTSSISTEIYIVGLRKLPGIGWAPGECLIDLEPIATFRRNSIYSIKKGVVNEVLVSRARSAYMGVTG